MKLFLKILGCVLFVALIGGFFYWQSVKRSPQYSLALLVDAARRDDREQIDKIVDTESVVQNFMPQITDKAVELYGRNLPTDILSKVAQAATPFMPGIKQRARDELPRLIRERTAAYEKVPYWMIALGANRAVDVKIDRDEARVTSKIKDRPVELIMKREGDLWRIVAVKDDVLARKIAEKVGQEIIAMANKDGLNRTLDKLGVPGLKDIIEGLEGVFK